MKDRAPSGPMHCDIPALLQFYETTARPSKSGSELGGGRKEGYKGRSIAAAAI